MTGKRHGVFRIKKKVKMSNYRIKIRELMSGHKEYIPQFREKCPRQGWGWRLLSVFLGGQGCEWQNLCNDDIYKKPFVSKSMTQIFRTEEEATKLIEEHREHLKREQLNEIKRLCFKEVG